MAVRMQAGREGRRTVGEGRGWRWQYCVMYAEGQEQYVASISCPPSRADTPPGQSLQGPWQGWLLVKQVLRLLGNSGLAAMSTAKKRAAGLPQHWRGQESWISLEQVVVSLAVQVQWRGEDDRPVYLPEAQVS